MRSEPTTQYLQLDEKTSEIQRSIEFPSAISSFQQGQEMKLDENGKDYKGCEWRKFILPTLL